MFEIRRPEPKAALTWIAVWFIALIGLALPPPRPGLCRLPL